MVNIFTLFEEIEALKQENIGVKGRYDSLQCTTVDCTSPTVHTSYLISIKSVMVSTNSIVEV